MQDFKIEKIQTALEKAMEKIVQEKIGNTLPASTSKGRHRRPLKKTKIRVKSINSRPQEPIRIFVLDSLLERESENEEVENEPESRQANAEEHNEL